MFLWGGLIILNQKECFGIDIDSKSRWSLLRCYFNLRSAFPTEDVVVYETRHGYHLILPNVKTDLELRRVYGDDMMRIEFEENRSDGHGREPQDILFYRKRILHDGKTVSSYTREKISVMAEPFYISGAGCC